MIEAIIKANNNLKQSTSNGDLELIGKDVKRLQELIDQLNKTVKEEEKKKQEENVIANMIMENSVVE